MNIASLLLISGSLLTFAAPIPPVERWQVGSEAAAMLEQGDPAIALPVLRAELGRCMVANPSSDACVELLWTVSMIARMAGDPGGGEAEARRSIELAERALPSGHLDIAQGYGVLGQALFSLRRNADAETAFRKSLVLREAKLPAGDQRVATARHNLASALDALKRYSEAELLYRKILADAGPEPSGADLYPTLHNFSLNLIAQGRHGDAAEVYEYLLPWLERNLPAGDPRLFQVYDELVSALYEAQFYAAAEPLARKALAIRETAMPQAKTDIAAGYGTLGLIIDEQGRFAEAEPLFRKALALAEAEGVQGEGLAIAYNNLATNLVARGSSDEAEALLTRALAIREAVVPIDPGALAGSYNNLGALLKSQARYDEAVAAYRKALMLIEELKPPARNEIAIMSANLALVLQEQGNVGEAEALFRSAIADAERAVPPAIATIARSHHNLGSFLNAQDRFAEAEPLHRKAAPMLAKALGATHPAVGMSYAELASALKNQRRFGEASEAYQKARTILEGALPAQHPHIATLYENQASNYWELKQYDEAESLSRKAVTLRAALPPAHPLRSESYGNLAVLLQLRGRDPAEIRSLFRRAEAGLHERLRTFTAFDIEAQREIRRFRPVFTGHVRAAWQLADPVGAGPQAQRGRGVPPDAAAP